MGTVLSELCATYFPRVRPLGLAFFEGWGEGMLLQKLHDCIGSYI